MPDISFPSSPSGGDTYTYNNITFTYDGEKWTAKAPVTTTSTYGDANVAAYASAQGFIDLTDISVTSNSPSGNGSLSYNNGSGVFTFTPADASGSGGGSYGNTEVQAYLDDQGYSNVDLDAQAISIAGNVISITGNASTVDLTSALGNVSGGSGISNVVEDTTPQLGGNLALNGYIIEETLTPSTTNAWATITNGSNGSITTNFVQEGIYSQDGIVRLQSATGNVFVGTLDGQLSIYSVGGSITTSGATGDLHIQGGTNAVKIDDNYYPTADGSAGQALLTYGNGYIYWGNVNTNIQPTTITADSTDGTALTVEGGDATGLNSTGGNVVVDAGTGALQNGYVNIGQSSQGVNIGANSSTAISLTGPVTVNNQLIIEDGVSEKFSSLTGATGVVTHDCDNGHIFYHTSISADFTANFTNLGLSTNYGTTLTLILDQGATARIPSAVQIGGVAQTINWQGGSAPTGTNNGIDAVSFTILRVSGSYVVLGQLVDFT